MGRGVHLDNLPDEVHYTRARIENGESPSLAEIIDNGANLNQEGDGVLTPDEFARGKELLKEYGYGINIFSVFKSYADYKPANGIANEFVVPQKINETYDTSAKKKYEIATTLINFAKIDEDYNSKVSHLSQAGLLFVSIGMTREAVRIEKLLANAAREFKMKDDETFHLANLAALEGRVDDVEVYLKELPKDFKGYNELSKFASEYRRKEKLLPTFIATAAVAQVCVQKLKDMRNGILSGIFPDELNDRIEGIEELIKAWEKFLNEEGRFTSTRDIFSWLDKTNLKARKGILALKKAWVPMDAMLTAEENGDIEKLRNEFDILVANGDETVGQEVSALAKAYSMNPRFKLAMQKFANDSESLESSSKVINSLKGFTETENLITMYGGFGLARITTAALMAKLFAPTGVEGATFLARKGVEISESIIEGGTFTIYGKMLKTIFSTKPVDWSKGAIAQEWAALSLCLGFVRGLESPLRELRKGMAKTKIFGVPDAKPIRINGFDLPALTTAGELTLASVGNIAQTSAFYMGGIAGHKMSLRDASPTFFDEWLNLVSFQLSTKLANKASNGYVDKVTYKIKSKPILEAAMEVAKGLSGKRPALANGLMQHIYMGHINGNISASDIVKLGNSMRRGNVDTIDSVIDANKILEDLNLPLVFDGRGLYEASADVRNLYISELRSEKSKGPKKLTPAYAAVDADASARPPVDETNTTAVFPQRPAILNRDTSSESAASPHPDDFRELSVRQVEVDKLHADFKNAGGKLLINPDISLQDLLALLAAGKPVIELSQPCTIESRLLGRIDLGRLAKGYGAYTGIHGQAELFRDLSIVLNRPSLRICNTAKYWGPNHREIFKSNGWRSVQISWPDYLWILGNVAWEHYHGPSGYNKFATDYFEGNMKRAREVVMSLLTPEQFDSLRWGKGKLINAADEAGIKSALISRAANGMLKYRGPAGYDRFALDYFEGNSSRAWTTAKQLLSEDQFDNLNWTKCKYTNVKNQEKVRSSLLKRNHDGTLRYGNEDGYDQFAVDSYSGDSTKAWLVASSLLTADEFELLNWRKEKHTNVHRQAVIKADLLKQKPDGSLLYGGEGGYDQFALDHYNGDSMKAWMVASSLLTPEQFRQLGWRMCKHSNVHNQMEIRNTLLRRRPDGSLVFGGEGGYCRFAVHHFKGNAMKAWLVTKPLLTPAEFAALEWGTSQYSADFPLKECG